MAAEALKELKSFMSSLFRACARLAVLSATFVLPALLRSQTVLRTPVAAVGGEYSITRGLVGDQIKPVASFTATGGYVAWQDNGIDGDGWGIAAVKLDQSLSPQGPRFRVNAIGLGNQTSPQVASFPNGGAAFVWQGGINTAYRIYARFLLPNGNFTSANDILVNANITASSITPAIAALPDGSVIVVWASYGVDDAANGDAQLAGMLGVFAQRFNSVGDSIGGQFQVNRTVLYNQRNPAVAALADGNYVVAWVTESISGAGTGIVSINGVNVMYRKFTPAGAPLIDETHGNDHLNAGANPEIGATSDGGFTLFWVERDLDIPANSLDIYGRTISSAGFPTADSFLVNSYTYGDQFAPQIATSGSQQLVVWSSLAQEGFRESVYGRFINSGAPASDELRFNTSTLTAKQDPFVAATPSGGFLVLWDGYSAGGMGYEIYAQRRQNSWPALPPPTVTALTTNQLLVTWNPLMGFGNVVYQLYMDANPPVQTTFTNWYSPNNLRSGSLHTFRLGYKIGGVVSPSLSSPVAGVTLSPTVTASQTGVVTQTVVGSLLKLSWTTTVGSSYQLQLLTGGTWVSVGSPRKAPGKTDYVFIKQKLGTYQYRVVKL